jgi:hypothetical protein
VGVIKIVLFPEFWNEQEIIAFSCEIQWLNIEFFSFIFCRFLRFLHYLICMFKLSIDRMSSYHSL